MPYKSVDIRSLCQARANQITKQRSASKSAEAPRVTTSNTEDMVIQEFQKQREVVINLTERLPTSADDDYLPHKRVPHTGEHKLADVGLVWNRKPIKEDGSQHLVSNYSIAKKLGITTTMLRKWIKDTSDIEAMSKSRRKNNHKTMIRIES